MSARSRLATVGLIWGAFAGCEEVRQVELVFAQDNAGSRGFHCLERSGTPILLRAVDGAGASVTVNLVVEFVATGETPDCRIAPLLAFCESGDCRPLTAHRRCLPLDVDDFTNPQQLRDSFEVALADVTGSLVSPDAPTGPVVVRVVGTAQPCSELENGGPLRCDQIVGCARSCPVTLEDHSGELLLDADSLGLCQEFQVNVCASPDLRRESACEPSSQ